MEALLLALQSRYDRAPRGPYTLGWSGDGSGDVTVIAAVDGVAVFVESLTVIAADESDDVEVSDTASTSKVGPFPAGARVPYEFGPFDLTEGEGLVVTPAAGVAIGGTVTWWNV